MRRQDSVQVHHGAMVNSELKKVEIQSQIRLSNLDGFGFGAMTGFGETYLVAFALALGTGEAIAGLVASVPIFVGGMCQLISPRMIRKCRSKKTWVLSCAIAQALSFFPLIILACYREPPTILLFAFVSLYWAAGMSGTPAWNAWLGRIVPPHLTAGFLARRTQWLKLGLFVGFLVGGIALRIGSSFGLTIEAFIALFSAAILFRLISVFCLSRQICCKVANPVPASKDEPIRFRDLFSGASGPVLIYLVLMQLAVQFAAPFFTPFMLEQLNFDYGGLVSLLTVSFVAKFTMLSIWAKYANRFGVNRLLLVAGILVVPMSGLWLVSDSFVWLLFVQFISGAAWAAYELAFFLLFFSSIPERQRIGLISKFSFINSAAWCLGALLGAYFLTSFGESRTGYSLIFAGSAVLRLMCVPLLLKLPKEGIDLADLQPVSGLGRPINIRPNATSFVTVLPSQAKAESKTTSQSR